MKESDPPSVFTTVSLGPRTPVEGGTGVRRLTVPRRGKVREGEN